jgi:hypothetical protein
MGAGELGMLIGTVVASLLSEFFLAGPPSPAKMD